MPRYVYVCKKCEKELNVAHSITEKLEACEEANCDGELERKPSFFFTTSNIQGEEKVGDVVKNSIEGFKEDLKTEKRQLTGRDYKEND